MSDLTCYICQGPFEMGENISRIPCGHEYHAECLDCVQSTSALRQHYINQQGIELGFQPEQNLVGASDFPKPCPCCRREFNAEDITTSELQNNVDQEEASNDMQLVLSSAQNTSDATLTVFNPNLEESMQQMTLIENGIGPVSNALVASSTTASDIPSGLILSTARESIIARRGKGTTGHKPKTEVIRKGPATTGGKKKTEVIRKGPATTGGKKKTEVIR